MNNEEKILAILEKLDNRIGSLEVGQTKVRQGIDSINLRLELDVEKRFDAVNEGIDTILERVTPQSRVEALEDDVALLKTAIKAMSQRLAELEKAQ